ncbi:MAG: hypothetical protein ACJ71K_20285 [Nitrososphaeraceae archaeon]|jgi:hypothetical protein
MDQSSNKDILREEIKSWEHFEYALREENRLIFSKMLSECKEEYYIKAATSKDEFFSAESLFMVLILQQQKMINDYYRYSSVDHRRTIELFGSLLYHAYYV